ncbi:MAG: acyl-CoA thioesterase [Endozoicomonas sp. (ex Botrylloides leachii)]|nr:acyl-CoA thioesterase [Endozoicomonas sp. (ex Botrylloides leachii)]
MDQKVFSTEMNVQVIHLNYGNHLAHDATVRMLEESRMRWIKTFNSNASEVSLEGNIGWVVKSFCINYESEATHGQTLRFDLYPKNLKRTSLEIIHVVTNLSIQKRLCKCDMKLVFSNRINLKVARAPTKFFDFISAAMTV